jgi:hypothetical protein
MAHAFKIKRMHHTFVLSTVGCQFVLNESIITFTRRINHPAIQKATMARSPTITGTSAPDETSNLNTSINGFNILNLIVYVINVAVTYLIGVAGILGQPTNADLSLKYQTLVTPIGWAFSIWGLIFFSQLVWAIYQIASRKQRNSVFVTAVGNNYAYAVLFQAVWSLSFSYEVIWLSIISISLLLVCLWIIVDRLERIETKVTLIEYILWFFPFTIHCGWITAATALNFNVVFVSGGLEYGHQYYGAVCTLILLVVVAATWLLRDTPEYVIPLVLSWACLGIYSELADPVEAISDNFDPIQIRYVKDGAILITGLVVVGCGVRNLITLCSISAKDKAPEEEGEGEEVDYEYYYTRAEF